MTSSGLMIAGRIESARLSLEPLRVDDADELALLLHDRDLYQFIGGQAPTPTELRNRFARQVEGVAPDGQAQWLNWTVRVRVSGQAAGMMQATVARRTLPVAELAWLIGVSHQRQGFASEAAAGMASWLGARGVRSLRALINPGHRASLAVARSIGMEPTSVWADGEQRWECSYNSARPAGLDVLPSNARAVRHVQDRLDSGRPGKSASNDRDMPSSLDGLKALAASRNVTYPGAVTLSAVAP